MYRIYAINIPEKYTLNCNATWNENINSIKFPTQKNDGTYSNYNKTELWVGHLSAETEDNHFTE